MQILLKTSSKKMEEVRVMLREEVCSTREELEEKMQTLMK